MKKSPIFMSLGSQYDLKTALTLLNPGGNSENLKKDLEEKFKGKAILTYKGRDAIQILLENLKDKSREFVFMQGFACYAIEEAIVKAKFKPGFVDTSSQSVNLDIDQIKKAQAKYGLPAAIIIQHTFGVPAEMEPVRRWCSANSVALIEDLAQSYGAFDENNQLLGLKSDAVIFSFGRDKIIDAVTGGALVIISQKYFDDIEQREIDFQKPEFWPQISDSIYPLLTVLIRKTYPLGLGKAIHSLTRKLKILRSPLFSHYEKPSEIPKNFAELAFKNIHNLNSLAEHRKKIAGIYYKELNNFKNVKILVNPDQISKGANLRFPIWVENPAKVSAFLAKSSFFISDRWYRSVIDCSSLNCNSSYQSGICPNAEEIADHALQLPTHIQISEEKATKTVKLLKEYYG